MRILAISDIPERLLYDDFSPERWRSRVDLVLSCGDLDREYLERMSLGFDLQIIAATARSALSGRGVTH